jgi:hypothetical protein
MARDVHQIVGSRFCRVNPKTTKLVKHASLKRNGKDLLDRNQEKCASGSKFLSMDSCYSVISL